MANDYTTSTDAFADISEGSYSSSDYTQMAAFVTAASRLIDLEVGRWEGFFYPTTDSVTWYYDGSGEYEQRIDEFASISAVAVAELGGIASSDYTSWTLNTDYLVEPYNYSGQGKPITRLCIVDYNTTKAGWYRYQKSVQVTGIAGYSTSVPAAIALACRIQSVRWFMRAKGGYQDVTGSDSVGKLNYKGVAELDPDVKLLLMPFKLELER